MPINFIGKRCGGRLVAVTAMAGMLCLLLLIATSVQAASLQGDGAFARGPAECRRRRRGPHGPCRQKHYADALQACGLNRPSAIATARQSIPAIAVTATRRPPERFR